MRELIEVPLTQVDSSLAVSDFFQGHDWNWYFISFSLPLKVKEKIMAIPIQLYGNRKDSLMWKYSKDGKFTTNLAYLLASPNSDPIPPFQGQWV